MEKRYRLPIIVFSMILGGLLSRIHGGWIKIPKWIKNIMWAAPLGTVAASYYAFPLMLFIMTIATGLCIAGKSMGHGQYFSLAYVWKYIRPEKIDFIPRIFFGLDERTLEKMKNITPSYHLEPFSMFLYWRCVVGLATVGLAAVSGAVICIAPIDPMASIIIAIGGLLKPIGYMLGWKLFPNNAWPSGKQGLATTIGEWVAGICAYGSCAVAMFVVG